MTGSIVKIKSEEWKVIRTQRRQRISDNLEVLVRINNDEGDASDLSTDIYRQPERHRLHAAGHDYGGRLFL